MLFNSFEFAIFFVVVLIVTAAISRHHRAQNLFLLVASKFFYGWWNWRYIALLLATSFVDYYVGRRIAANEDPRRRRAWLAVSIGFNLSVLAYFKYLGFLVASAEQTLRWLGFAPHLPILDILLPMGISFFTFQSMAYAIDVYRGVFPAARSLLDYLLYVSFFPQMVAGPIERPGRLLKQIETPRTLRPEMFYSGLLLILWGLFKKVAVADNLATYVDTVYANSAQHTGSTLLFATYLFAFQIYCDFSGYSDMALGLARCLGFELVRNFKSPYFAESFQDFWRRWHISLSSWFRDYVYLPLGGSRGSATATTTNLLIVFLVSGLWHGANWTFVVWGGLHGLYVAAERAFRGATEKASENPSLVRRAVRVLVTFQLVCLAWVFFRAHSVHEAVAILLSMATRPGPVFWDPLLANGLVCLAFLLFVEWIQEPSQFDEWLGSRSALSHLWMSCALVLTLLLLGARNGVRFIYFQF